MAAEIGRFLRAIAWGAPAFLGFAVLRSLLAALGPHRRRHGSAAALRRRQCRAQLGLDLRPSRPARARHDRIGLCQRESTNG
ncbi:MAG: hypothetical protein WDO24_03525 [Pseudomonadota bacterium]